MKQNSINTRGRTFEGRVISDKMRQTVTVEWDRKKYDLSLRDMKEEEQELKLITLMKSKLRKEILLELKKQDLFQKQKISLLLK